MEVVTILVLLALNIALPTLDTYTDINLVVKLYLGAQYCDDGLNDYLKCEKDPVSYCSNDENNQAVCHLAPPAFGGYYFCTTYNDRGLLAFNYGYDECKNDPATYCSIEENNQAVCGFSSHNKMATAMLIPFLLNYIVCFITFLRKEKNKKFTFIFALLNIYPQFEAARIIYLLVKNPAEGKKKKKIFDQDIGLLETYLESVPSAFIITVIWTKAGPLGDPSLFNIIFNPHSHSLRIFGVPPDQLVAEAEFFTSYAISIISAALGLAKCLKNGVARPIAPGGPLDGLLSGKFVLAFLASVGVLVARGVCIGLTVTEWLAIGKNDVAFNLSLIIILLLFVPQFLLSLFSTLNFLNKSPLKILYRQPSLIILPTVTFFTFSRHNVGCCGDNNQVSFSKKFTWLNITISTVGYVVWVVWAYFNSIFDFIIILPLHVSSILLTALFLHLDKLCCCCCNPREQLSVYDPDLDKRFIMLDGEVVEDLEGDVETAEDDVETGSKTCCGWCRQTEEQQTKHDVAITVSNGDQPSFPVSGDVSLKYFSSSEHPAKVLINETEENVTGRDFPDNLHKDAATNLVSSEREEGDITDTTGEEAGEMNRVMTIRQGHDTTPQARKQLLVSYSEWRKRK